MQEDARWLLLVFTLPTSKASERVQIWRKLQRFGAIAFRNAGSLLPNTPENQERFEWLARTIRASHGEASILQIQAIDDLPSQALQDQFRNARAEDYTELIEDLQKLKPSVKGPSAQVQRLRRRFEDIVAIDFFTSPLRARQKKHWHKPNKLEQRATCAREAVLPKRNIRSAPGSLARALESTGSHLPGLSLASSMQSRSSSSYQPRRAQGCYSV